MPIYRQLSDCLYLASIAISVAEASGGTVQTPTGTSALTIGMWPMGAPRISQHCWFLEAVWSTLDFSGDANAKAQSQVGVPRCLVKASRRNRRSSCPQGRPVTRRAFEAWTPNWLQRESSWKLNCAFAAQRRVLQHIPTQRGHPSRAKIFDNASCLSASRSGPRVASADGNSQVQGYGPTRSIPRACT